MMLVDTTKKPESNEGFNPNVDNTELFANPTGKQKFLYNFLLVISWFPLIIPGIIWWVLRIKKTNWWIEQQMRINNAASSIDVNLTRRADTLIKLLEQAKGYLKHEKETLIKISHLRSSNASSDQNSVESIKSFNDTLNNIARSINIAVENYPDLKSNTIIRELMSTSDYIESEIAASRRLYNQLVQTFNASIFVFPDICFACKSKMKTFPLFAASEQQKKDIDMSSLSSI